MSAPVTATQNVAGDGQHVPALLERTPRGDERTAPLPRLDDHDGPRQPADDPIPLRKELRKRRCSRRELAQDQPGIRDLAREAGVFSRIDDIRTAAEHRNRGSPHRNGAPVRGRIDAARQTADDRHALTREIGREPVRHFERIGRRRARPHDCNGGTVEGRWRAPHPQHRGRIDDRRERGRIRRVAPHDRRQAARGPASERGMRARRQFQSRTGALPRSRSQRREEREQIVERGECCLAGAKPLANLAPRPDRQKRQRDEGDRADGAVATVGLLGEAGNAVAFVGHGRSSRVGSNPNKEGGRSRRVDMRGPTS